jgi:hypothetical protein
MDTGDQQQREPTPPAIDPALMETDQPEETPAENPEGCAKNPMKGLEVELEEESEEDESEEEEEMEEDEEEEEPDDGGTEEEQQKETPECSEELNQLHLDGFANGGFSNPNLVAMDNAREQTKDNLDNGLYIVCQVVNDSVVGVRKRIPRGWPFFMGIDDKLATDKLQIGDLVEVAKFEWVSQFRYLAAKQSEVTRDRKYWLNPNTGLLPRQAEAKEIAWTSPRGGLYQPTVGVIYFLRRRIVSDMSSLIYAEVACCGLAVSSRFNVRQLDGLSPADIVVGKLVTVMCMPLNADDLVEPRYIMPAQSPFKTGMEHFAGKAGALALIRPHQLIMPDPIFPYSVEFAQNQLECAEHVTAAAIQFAIERERTKLMDARFEGSAVRDVNSNSKFSLIFPPKTRSQVIALTEAWEVENLVQATRELGRAHFAQGEVIEIATEELKNGSIVFTAKVKLSNIQFRKDKDVVAEFKNFANGCPGVVFPVPSSGAEQRLQCFRDHLPSRLAREDTPRGKIMAALLNRPSDETWMMPTEEELNSSVERVNPAIEELNVRQRATAQRVLSGQGIIVNQQAPPGTGKTEVAVTLIKPLLENADEQVTVLACANLPITKLVEEASRVNGEDFLDSVKSLAMFSASSRTRYAKQIQAVRSQTLQEKFSSEELIKKLSKSEKQKVEEYMQQCVNKPRFVKERDVGVLFQHVANSKVVFCSASLAEDTLGGPLADTTTLIFDETTQAGWPILVHLVASMPRLRALLLTGDKHQLGTYLRELPQIFQAGFGLESVITQVERSPAVNNTYLTQMYRSHPFLVNCLSYASYEKHGELLVPSRPAEQRALVTGSNFPLPKQDCPVTLIHAYSQHRRDGTSESLTDDHQTEVVEYLVKALLANGFTKEQLVVLCMYSFQADQLDERLTELDIHVVTVDAYQAREQDIVILVTTRSRTSHRGTQQWQMDFFRDDRRATVALSRARHALFLIGDLVAIAEGPVWRRFVERALTQTLPVRGHYALDLFNQQAHHLPNGTLVGEHGRALEHSSFMADWQRYHGETREPQLARFLHFSEEWPDLPGRAGPARRRDEHDGRDERNRDRGNGRDGPRGRWNYGGNPRRQRGLH